MDGQILIWERTTRLEAGIKRELFARPDRPYIRACRTAQDVVDKRDLAQSAVLVLDEVCLKAWVTGYDQRGINLARLMPWKAVVAVAEPRCELRWQWTSAGVTRVLSGPLHDGRMADVCLAAFG